MLHPSFPCPKCGKKLLACGEVVYKGRTFPSYQCDACIVQVEMFGEKVEAALTFCVDAGRAFDPASEDGSLPI